MFKVFATDDCVATVGRL